ncbi:NAD(P)H-dependent glycerol-3-phosphate dehydrogenase [Proteocatella sphenisci]|uniref:NAD(P)H-dependent glycerol-3-phosphate dehydrogenase n=1 Tax=Proteocatella sphenisci TaxID=181070 RepID=UPI00048D941C|nr:NAD(P)H-dependent glycerol-3-phosphate dehydrogenase [Proteocatella sphenisci]
MDKIAILGSGSWGTALGKLLAEKGNNVFIWGRNINVINDININKENSKYLKNIKLPENLNATSNIEEALKNTSIVILAVTSQSNRETLNKIKNFIDESTIIVNVSKGLEIGTNKRTSEIVQEILPNNKFVSLSGPSHAEEVAVNMPTTIVSASKSSEAMIRVQELFIKTSVRVYTNSDVTGVELAGAFKNIIALGIGIIDGLGFGDNTKAAMMTRGLVEIVRLSVELGADVSTFFGLAGMGDLIVTCTSPHSRNRRAGILIGKGYTLDEVKTEINMVVEGINATKIAYELSKKLEIDMPIVNEMYKVIFENREIKSAIANLMNRDKKHENEELINIKIV